MATSKEYLNFILGQLAPLDGITARQMMGEYMIYYRGKIAAYLCDGRLLLKPVAAAEALLPDAKYEPPYKGAKDMLLFENVDDGDFLRRVFEALYPELPEPAPKKAAKRRN